MELLETSCVLPIGAARIREIHAIEDKLAKCEHGARIFQKLPRHMQRRAVSSNPQRLPKSLRDIHLRQTGNKKVTKRPCRKYRRRSTNLLAEYNRRQKDNVWLETHIWHAKRFHMIKQWEYTLPKSPTMKCYRSTLRSATESCLIQDVSYENCIELEGQTDDLFNIFGNIVSTQDMESLKNPSVSKGLLWTKITIYYPNKIYLSAIGDVQIMYLPKKQGDLCCLWIWLHPCIYEEIFSLFTKLLELEMIINDSKTESKVECKNTLFKRNPKYVSKLNSLISVILLKDTLNKYRLIGPRSYHILKNALVLSTDLYKSNDNVENNNNDAWWNSFYNDSLNYEIHKKHESFWNSLSSDGSKLESKQIIGLVVRDPRLVLPVKKKALERDSDKRILLEPLPLEPYEHPIFDVEIRDKVTYSMKSTHEINKMRSQFLVPGSVCPLSTDESRVPVLLLCSPSNHSSGLGHGWDLILPTGWGRHAWVTLIMNGAVAGGKDQMETLINEFLLPPPPYLVPDTTAGREYMRKKSVEKEEEYFKRPPNCRLNFIKLGIKNPFGAEWGKLSSYYNENTDFHVLREKKIVKTLAAITCPKNYRVKRKKELESDEEHKIPFKIFKTDKEAIPKFRINYEITMNIPGNSLINVRLVLLGKGTIEPLALICLPEIDDLKQLLKDMKLPQSDGVVLDINEPPHEDVNVKLRAELKLKHKSDLARLRRKRRAAREKILCGESDPLKFPSIKEALTQSVKEVEENEKDLVQDIKNFNSKMNELWIVPKNQSGKVEGIRKTFGYVTSGGFCMRMGRSGGLGYVIAKPFTSFLVQMNLLSKVNGNHESFTPNSQLDKSTDENSQIFNQVFVLLRNPSSLQYRWARLIVLDLT